LKNGFAAYEPFFCGYPISFRYELRGEMMEKGELILTVFNHIPTLALPLKGKERICHRQIFFQL